MASRHQEKGAAVLVDGTSPARSGARDRGLSERKSALLDRLLERRGIRGAVPDTIPRRPDDGESPLSFAQERMWFLDRLAPGSAAYLMPYAVRLRGALSLPGLARSLATTVERHEVLRTRYETRGGEPVQVADPAAAPPLPVVDLSPLPGVIRERELRALAAREATRPLDLAAGGVLRVIVIRLAGAEHGVLLTLHHIAGDGASMEILVGELAGLYRAEVEGASPSLPLLAVQYADYAAWQRRRLSGEALEREVGWWRDRLAGLPLVLDLPTDRPRPPVAGWRGGRVPVAVPADVADGLRALGRSEGATEFMVWMAVFGILLGRYTGHRDLAVGAPTSGRDRLELEPLIGFFVNTLVLPVRMGDAPTFRELLGRTRDAVVEAREHQDLPFERLVGELQPERHLGHNPIVQAVATLDRRGGAREAPSLGGVVLERLDSAAETAKFDLALGLVADGGRVGGGMSYRRDLFDPTTVGRMARALVALAGELLRFPGRPVDGAPCLGAAERAQLLREWSDTAAGPAPTQRVEALVAVHVAEHPDAVAVTAPGRALSYGELGRRSGRVAAALAGRGVGAESRVGVCLERSPELPVALLGVLRAGAAYVPVDPAYASARAARILGEAEGAPVVVGDGAVAPDGVPAADLRELEAEGAARPDRPVPPALGLRSLAYVVYTSGSTGVPKGVAVPHEGLVNLVAWHAATYCLRPGMRTSLVASPAFDASVWEVWSALATGATLAVPAPETVMDPEEILDWLARERVDACFLPTPLAEEVLDLEPPAGLALRTLLTGGDVLHRGPAPGAPYRLVNHYGPTESSVVASAWPVPAGQEAGGPPPVGRPLHNTRLHVTTPALRPVPLGAAGELCIAGTGLARGYHGRPAWTAERFVPDPFGRSTPGGRIYRTGDVVRWRSDGALRFLGRRDGQVKVNGVRIELGEVESALGRHPAVRECAVVAAEGPAAGRRLVAYVVPEAGEALDAERLRSDLERLLPRPMVPQVYRVLDRLPRSPHGKLDRRALPAPTAELGEGWVPPQGVTEEVVAGIYADVLARDRVGADDDFFELGGHSLLATRVVSRIAETLGVEMSLRSLFEAPTVAGLASAVEDGRRRCLGLAGEPIEPVSRAGDLPVSFAQERLWFIDQLHPGSPEYNVPVALRLEGELDAVALARALRGLVARHEVLRTTFSAVDDTPRQRISEAAQVPLPVVDLRRLDRAAADGQVRRLAREEARRPFDLSRGPVLRTSLLRRSARHHAALVTLHHIAADGWSMPILVREVSALYDAARAGRRPALPVLPVQYADFAAWQRAWLQGPRLQAEIDHWRTILEGLPAQLELPVDRPRSAAASHAGADRRVALGADLSRAVGTLARRRRATVFMTLLAGFQALLARYSGQDDLAVGTPVAGRNRVEVEGLIGLFVNTLVLRADLSGPPSFEDLLDRVRHRSLEAYAHQDLPFEKLVEALQPARSLARSPLFQVLFTVRSERHERVEVPGLEIAPLSADLGIVKFELTLDLADGPEGIAGALRYRTALFDSVTIERLGRHFEALVRAAVETPDRAVSDLPLHSPAERHQLLTEWPVEGSAAPSPRPLDELFHDQLERTPERIAVTHGSHQVSFVGLARTAQGMAAAFRAAGLRSGGFLVLDLDRSIGQLAAVLAAWRLGAAFVPVDPSRAPARRRLMVEDVAATGPGGTVIATATPESWNPPVAGAAVVRVGRGPAVDAAAPATAPASSPSFPAYVIYTSGSTGRPKGVAVRHDSVVVLAGALEERIYRHLGGLDEGRVALNAPLWFDASIQQLIQLLRGRTVCLVDEPARRDPRRMVGFLEVSRVQVLDGTPTHVRMLLDAGLARGAPDLQALLVGGEPLEPDLWARLAALRATRSWNLYGPTECTVDVSAERIEGSARPSVGRPLAGCRALVLDRALRPVPEGVVGELCVAGMRLAQGYVSAPGRTAERFVPLPVPGAPGERLYRTGDRSRFLPAGRLAVLGRLDRQVKVHGVRVEPGEIEAALEAHPSVARAAVLLRSAPQGDPGLVAYVVPAEGGPALPGVLRGFLAERVPPEMVPRAFPRIEAVPLTPNGKLDPDRLPDPDWARSRSGRPYEPPRTEAEEALASIWEEVLGVERLGVRDDFFELGGHSMLAVRMVGRLRRRLGVDLPVAALFEHRTVEALAALLDAGNPAERRQPLVPIQPGGRWRPLFFVHAVGGEVFSYVELARLLGNDQPVYGLQAVHGAGEVTVPDLARDYVSALGSVDAAGPYRLAGWSMGGAVAFEMARQLSDAGRSVELLAVLDGPPGGGGSAPPQGDGDLTDSALRDLAATAGVDAGRPAGSDAGGEKPAAAPLDRLRRAGLDGLDLTEAELRHRVECYAANFRAFSRYRPEPVDIPLVLFRAGSGGPPGLPRDLGWSSLVADLRLVEVPGDHYSMLRPPHVEALAERFRELLEASDRGSLID